MQALDPPHLLSITHAISLLQSIGCLDDQEDITILGKAVGLLPLNPRIARVILLGILCGCGPSILSTIAAMGYRDPFVMPTSDQQKVMLNIAKMNLSLGLPSDQISLLKALQGFDTACVKYHIGKGYRFCDENFLSRSAMSYLVDLVRQLSSTLKESGIEITKQFYQRNNGNMALLMSLIGIGIYPDVGMRQKGDLVFTTEKGRKAKIHPSSVNSKNPNYKSVCKTGIELVGYQGLISAAVANPTAPKLLMLNTNPVSIFSLLITGGNIKILQQQNGGNIMNNGAEVEDGEKEVKLNVGEAVVEVDGWIRLIIDEEVLSIIYSYRSALKDAVEEFLTNPDVPPPDHVVKIVDGFAQALSIEQPNNSSSQNQQDIPPTRNYNTYKDQQQPRDRMRGGRGK